MKGKCKNCASYKSFYIEDWNMFCVVKSGLCTACDKAVEENDVCKKWQPVCVSKAALIVTLKNTLKDVETLKRFYS